MSDRDDFPDARSPRIALWCDLGRDVGAGHVMRCYALSQALTRANAKSVFVCDGTSIPWVEQWLAVHQRVQPSEVDWADFDAVVIDSYTITPEEAAACRERGQLLILIADDATPRIAADIYIEPGVNLAWRPPTGFSQVPRFAGPGAVLLRDEITSAPSWSDARDASSSPTPTVLVMLGGVDRPHYLSQLLGALGSIASPCDVLVVGSRAPTMHVPSHLNVVWQEPSANIGHLLAGCDVLITAAGVSAWEAMSLGVPMGIVRTFDNQEPNYQFISAGGLAVALGRLDEGDIVEPSSVRELLTDHNLWERLSQGGRQSVDGLGSERVAAAIMNALDRGPACTETGD